MIMTDLELCILQSLDGEDPRLLPFIPELLEDLFEMGSDPKLIEKLLSEHGRLPSEADILDLGCGKGAVSLHLAAQKPWLILGVDAMPAFIQAATTRAERMGLSDRCRFELADIRTWTTARRFCAVILGAIGPVLGSTTETLLHVAPFLCRQGKVVIDEAYPKDGVACGSAYRSRNEVFLSIEQAGFRLIAEARSDEQVRIAEYAAMFAAIKKRAQDLSSRLPHLGEVFEAYVSAQAREFRVLEEDVDDVTLLLERI
ncbi:MAG: class I SAM-dependent methyltransferase [Acidobacteria bacterium]|nr:class I SAM-dependent methyltransferase [Acidobacteriota bacterium]